MGSSCTCNCARTSPETALEEDSTTAAHAPKGHGGAMDEVKVPLGASGTVPVVAKFRVLRQSWPEGEERRTPRFEEVQEQDRTAQPGRHGDAQSPERSVPSAAEDTVEVYYRGDFLDAKRHGIGTLRMKSCTYRGDFWHGVQHGNAKLTWDDGREYSGQFRSGKFHGSAVMTWPDGRRYTGEYADNQKHGEGIFVWQDGRCYDGQWVSGKRHGVGTYTNAKGLSRRGTWNMDRPLCWESEAKGLDSKNSPEPADGCNSP